MTPFDIASRYIGLRELGDKGDHPFIQWCFSLCGWGFDTADEVPWCSAFMQHPCWECRVQRSKSAAARSWLAVGRVIALEDARPGYDVVILKRAGSDAGPEDLHAPGHVGFFAGLEPGFVHLLGGNQGNAVSVAPFTVERFLGARTLEAI